MLKNIICIWVLCGLVAYVLAFTYFRNSWPPRLFKFTYSSDVEKAVIVGLTGPIGLVASLIKTIERWERPKWFQYCSEEYMEYHPREYTDAVDTAGYCP